MTRSQNNQRQNLKSQILAVYSVDGDWKTLAGELNVPISTVYRWIKEGNKPDARGGSHNLKVNIRHKEFIGSLIEINPRITLGEMVDAIFSKFNLRFSKQTVARHLDLMMYSLKVSFEPERANTDENKIRRKEFVKSLLSFQASKKPILYMDESNFQYHISRESGSSVCKTRCNVIAADSKGANVHIIG